MRSPVQWRRLPGLVTLLPFGSESAWVDGANRAVAKRDYPGLSELVSVSEALSGAGVVHALGGTGLLFGLGFDVEPRDWDILTEAPVEHIKLALRDWPIRLAGPSRFFPSDYLVQIPVGESNIEIIGNFAIAAPGRVFRIPTRIRGRFRGIPLSHPADWILAYRAMEWLPLEDSRPDGQKIAMLERALRRKEHLAGAGTRPVVSANDPTGLGL